MTKSRVRLHLKESRSGSIFQKSSLSLLMGYLLSVATLLVAWELASRAFGLVLLFPPPTVTLRRFAELVGTGELPTAAVISLLRILAGFVIGSALGTLL